MLEGAVVTFLGLFTFLVRSFFSRIHGDLKELNGSIDKLGGRLESLQKDVRDNTIESAVTRKEMEAIWRVVDGSYKRASDQHKNGG